MLARILEPREWQMTPGERAALEGLLAALEPHLGIEIGTAQGGSLARIAAHCREVHSFDLEHEPGRHWPANAELHSGDSHVLLAELLDRLAGEGRNVDFVLVDGDHTTEGARQDLEDLLDSSALGRTALLLHDTLNPDVRSGFLAAGLESRPEVVHFDLDFVPGHLSRGGPFAGQLWGGLGLVLVDRGAGAPAFALGERSRPGEFEDPFEVFSSFRRRRGLLGRLRRHRQ
jgi:hypothetical protein